MRFQEYHIQQNEALAAKAGLLGQPRQSQTVSFTDFHPQTVTLPLPALYWTDEAEDGVSEHEVLLLGSDPEQWQEVGFLFFQL